MKKGEFKNFDHIIGQKYGALTAKYLYRDKDNKPRVVCICDCGNEKDINLWNFVRGVHFVSCGCMKGKRYWIKYDSSHPLYEVWTGIKMRCYNVNNCGYKNYGGRGITMCDEWKNDFKAFVDWAIENGWRKGLFIDKDIKGDSKIYSPETCSIVTRAENNRKRRMVKLNWDAVNDILSSANTAKELAEKYNCSISSINSVKYKKT